MYPLQFGDETADIYDWMFGSEPADADQLSVLHGLAQGRPALEIGVGTGVLAVGLAELGTPVTGIDISDKMLAKARAKAGSLPVNLVKHDISLGPVPGQFGLCFASINTFFMLGDHAAQRVALANMVTVLMPQGKLVLETFNAPRHLSQRDRQSVKVSRIAPEAAWMELNVYDEQKRHFDIADIVFRKQGSELYTTHMAYWHLDDLDVLAGDVGLALTDRWSDWSRTPFRDTARDAISIYTKE